MSWHASAKTASHATLHRFDLNQPIALRPKFDFKHARLTGRSPPRQLFAA
jgi:hypothetical protein